MCACLLQQELLLLRYGVWRLPPFESERATPKAVSSVLGSHLTLQSRHRTVPPSVSPPKAKFFGSSSLPAISSSLDLSLCLWFGVSISSGSSSLPLPQPQTDLAFTFDLLLIFHRPSLSSSLSVLPSCIIGCCAPFPLPAQSSSASVSLSSTLTAALQFEYRPLFAVHLCPCSTRLSNQHYDIYGRLVLCLTRPIHRRHSSAKFPITPSTSSCVPLALLALAT